MILNIIIRILLAALFIFSAYTKTIPLEYFEYFLHKMGFSFFWVQWIARLIIWVEFSLGLGFLFLPNIKKLILPASFILLIVFNIQLIYTLFAKGNTEDCGCFGNYLSFSPAQALIKNIISILLIAFIYIRNIVFYEIKKVWNFVIYGLIIIVPISYILFISPPRAFFIYDSIQTEFENNQLNTNLLYESDTFEKPNIDLRKGKHVLVFLSLTCPHCKMAALKLHALKYKNPNLPIWMILNGETKDIASFFEESKASNVPYSRLNGKGFIEITEYEVPKIFFVNNSKIEKN